MKNHPIKTLITAGAISLIVIGAPLSADEHDAGSDLWAEASLTTTYTLNRHLNPFDIDVEVRNGVATLKGTVDSMVEKDLAEELALGVDNIQEVVNNLEVNPVPAEATRSADQQRDERNPDRDFMGKVEDANLTAKVKSQLLWNTNTHGLDIAVDTHSGVVTLSGVVRSDQEAQLAEQIAKNTNEVKRVDNQLRIDKEKVPLGVRAERETERIGQNISDGWITTKVKSALLYSRNVDGTDINVDTENGVVILRGHIDSEFERGRAIEIASGIKGVKSVKSELQGG